MGKIAETTLKILHDGLITRDSIRGYQNKKYNHVCLYKKNDYYDYEAPNNILKSARSGWINGGFVFVISPDIEAIKAGSNDTDLVDEWRSAENIESTKIVGLALPYDYIKEYLNEKYLDDEIESDKQQLRMFLKVIEKITSERGIFLTNSQIPNFTDTLDFELSKSKKFR